MARSLLVVLLTLVFAFSLFSQKELTDKTLLIRCDDIGMRSWSKSCCERD